MSAVNLAKGEKYDVNALVWVGWTKGDGSGHEGYRWQDYFSTDGTYSGPDIFRIEPIVVRAADAATGYDALSNDDLVAVIESESSLSDRSHCGGCDASYTATWVESSEGKEWDLPAYALILGSRVVMWTKTDEAGVEDVTVEDLSDDLIVQLAMYADDIASDLAL